MNPENLTIPDWVNWITQDADGVVWGYEVGRSVKLANKNDSIDWHNSLTKVD